MKDPTAIPGNPGERSGAAAPTLVEGGAGVLRPIIAAYQDQTAGPGTHYAHVAHLVPVPICVCDAMGRLSFTNRAAAEVLGWRVGAVHGDDPGAGWFAMRPRDGSVPPFVINPLLLALREGRTFRDLDLSFARVDGSRLDASVTIEPLRDASGRVEGAITVIVDVTERRRRERHGVFMARLADALTTANDEGELVRIATTQTGQFLGVHRCGFVEHERDSGVVKVIAGWVRDAQPSLAGRHELQAFGDAEWQRTLGSARLAIGDVTEHERTRAFAEAYRAHGIRAYAGVPFIRDGCWVASLTVTTEEARHWSSDELNVLDDVLARVWPLIERARAQAALQLVTASAPVVLAYFDRECRIVFANQAFASRWGSEPSGLVGRHLADVIGQEAFDLARPYVDRVLTGEPVQFEMEVPYRQLGRRYVRVSCAPDGGRGRPVRGFLSAVNDLTDRRAMEQALRESEERYRELIRTLPVALYVCDAVGRLVLYNDAAAELWGRRPELGGELWGGAIAAYDANGNEIPRADWPLAEALRTATTPMPREVQIERPDGSRRQVVAHPQLIRDGAGQVTGGMNVLVDITERKRAEAGVRDRDERLGLATRTGKLGIWDWDIVADRVTWSDSLYEIHGIDRAAFTPTVAGFARLVHPEDQPLVAEKIKASLAAGEAYEVEFRALRPDGTVAWLFTNARIVRKDGRPERMVGATFDITERKQAELARKASEERFRTLAQHAPVGIFQTDPQGHCTFVNDYWCRLAALEADEALGLGWTRAVHPDDRVRVTAAWQAAVADGAPFLQEYRLLRPDATTSWIQASGVEFRDEAGVLVGYIGTVVDISERKVSEFALRESEKRFRLVASRAPVGIFMTSPQGETVFVNASWCAMAGLSPEEAAGLRWAEVLHPDDRERVMVEWQDAVRQGVSSKAEYRFVRRDGKVIWVHGTAVQLRDANGRLTGYIGTVADFTERKEAEIALRESEERFRLLADNIMQFAWICDADGKMVWVNRRMWTYAGTRSADEAVTALGAMQHPEHAERVTAKFRHHLKTGEPWEDSFPLRGPDGTYRWFLSRAIPIRDEEGRITRWFGTNTDITDLRETQDMLRKTQEELLAHTGDLERKVEARTASLRDAIVQMEEFSYSVSHDLRAPLRAMNTYAEALVEDYGPKLDDTAREYLARIQRSSQRMEKLTHDVLTYSRLARTEMVHTAVDLGAVVRDLIGQYSELQPAAADFTIEEPLHRVRGHELSVGQCLGNLLTNAAKFVAPGVRPRIRVYTTEEGGRVRVWVQDNGIGIKPDHQRNLFQMFERVPTKTPYDGTGIGLAIVRKAIEKMGGRYGVESDGTSGSRFWIELPKG